MDFRICYFIMMHAGYHLEMADSQSYVFIQFCNNQQENLQRKRTCKEKVKFFFNGLLLY